MQSVMLDLETAGVAPDCIVLSLGAVKFDPYSDTEPDQPFYVRPNVDEQDALGRAVDPKTIEWWSTQSKEAQDEAFGEGNRLSLTDFTSQLNKYLAGVDKVWANGIVFDIGIIEHLYKQLKQPAPWAYWQIRDSRTLFDFGDDSVKKNNTAAHNALADAYCQAKAVQNIIRELGVKKK